MILFVTMVSRYVFFVVVMVMCYLLGYVNEQELLDKYQSCDQNDDEVCTY